MNAALESGESTEVEPNQNFGTVVYVHGDQLVTRGDSGLEHTYTVLLDAEITGHGKGRTLSDLNIGSRVRIVQRPDDARVLTAVECLRMPGSALD